MIATLLFLGFVYLLASIPFGVVITTLYGGDLDVRLAGSGNIGATNVARVFGWKIAGPVLGLDVLKGFLPVLASTVLWPDSGVAWPCVVGTVAFIGHCWPIFLEFRGGKGVATGAGVMLALAPLPTLLAALLWVALLLVTGKSSMAALGSTLAMLALIALLSPELVGLVGLLALGVGFRHATNVGRLVRGEEQQVIRPVRWSRNHPLEPTADEVLGQDPSGGSTPAPVWKERVADPLRPEG